MSGMTDDEEEMAQELDDMIQERRRLWELLRRAEEVISATTGDWRSPVADEINLILKDTGI
jgi:hypothetical protein